MTRAMLIWQCHVRSKVEKGKAWAKAETVVFFPTLSTRLDTLARSIDYNLLLGADLILISDDNCDDDDSPYIAKLTQVLEPYIAAGRVYYTRKYRCRRCRQDNKSLACLPHWNRQVQLSNY